jgi:hypothetical protein
VEAGGRTPSLRACAWRWAAEVVERTRRMAAPVRRAVALMGHGRGGDGRARRFQGNTGPNQITIQNPEA